MTKEIILAGFGGQGILFAGKALAYSGLEAGREISWLPSYGPEMRGGTANCSVVISDDPIGSPLVTEPDILIVMNTPSYDKFMSDVKTGGMIFADTSMVDISARREGAELYGIPASQLAADNGLDGMGNIILLGKALKESGLFGFEQVEAGLKKCVSAKKKDLLEKNLRAVKIGMQA